MKAALTITLVFEGPTPPAEELIDFVVTRIERAVGRDRILDGASQVTVKHNATGESLTRELDE